jgi:autotransporter translocation and assembly factor TamB
LASNDFQLGATFNRTELAPVFGLLGQNDLRGTIGGTFEAAGNARQWQNCTAELKLRDVRVGYKDMRLLTASALDARYANARITVPGFDCAVLDSGRLHLQGSGGIEGPYDYAVDCALPAHLIDLLAPDISDARGTLSLHGTLQGTAKKPLLTATSSINGLGFTIPTLEQELRNCKAQLQISPKAIAITSLSGNVDDGKFTGSGSIGLNGTQLGQLALNISAQALPLSIPNSMDFRLNGNLALSGTPDDSRLEGSLELIDGAYYQDWRIPIEDVARKPRPSSRPAAGPPPPYLRNLVLEIALRARNALEVDNTIANIVTTNISIVPDGAIIGTLTAPIFVGQATVEEGTLQYLRRTFEVQRGVIDFINPYSLEPTFDIEGSTDVSSWKIKLNVSGTPKNLVFDLSSQPLSVSAPKQAIEDQDIVSLLLTGRLASDLSLSKGADGKSTTSQSTAVQSAEELVRQIAGTLLEGELKNKTGLDVLALEAGGSSDSTAQDRIKITIGKNLTKRLTTEYTVQADGNNVAQGAAVQYKVLENLQLRSYNTTAGDYGGEVQFILEFH